MFQEQIASLTADHLRSHIGEYLAFIETWYATDDQVKLVLPKGISVASAVGGMFKDFDRILPAYSVDVWGKAESITVDNLITYDYVGQISGMISSNSRDSADKLIKRHAAGVELFFRNHERMHEMNTSNFRLIGFSFTNTEFSGAEYLAELNGREVWIAGFSFDCIWTTSEAMAMQHG